MFLRLTWLLMLGVIGAHAAMAAQYQTTDPCRAVAMVAAQEVRDGQSMVGMLGAGFVARSVESRLREHGLMACYGAMLRVMEAGGFDPVLRAQLGFETSPDAPRPR